MTCDVSFGKQHEGTSLYFRVVGWDSFHRGEHQRFVIELSLADQTLPRQASALRHPLQRGGFAMYYLRQSSLDDARQKNTEATISRVFCTQRCELSAPCACPRKQTSAWNCQQPPAFRWMTEDLGWRLNSSANACSQGVPG